MRFSIYIPPNSLDDDGEMSERLFARLLEQVVIIKIKCRNESQDTRLMERVMKIPEKLKVALLETLGFMWGMLCLLGIFIVFLWLFY